MSRVTSGEPSKYVAVGVLTPLAYVAYLVFAQLAQGDPVRFASLSSTDTKLFFLILSVIGCLGLLGWRYRARVGAVIATIELLGLPWVYTTVPLGDAGVLLVPLLSLLIGSGVELAVRSPERLARSLGASDVRIALVVGVAHLSVGSFLQLYARSGLPGLIVVVGLVVSTFTLVSTGVVAVLLWTRKRLVSPSATVVLWVVWGIYGTWRTRNALPLTAFDGVDWTRLAPHPDYMLQSTVLVVLIVAVSSAEVLIKHER